MATPAQQALFQLWAAGTKFVLDPHASPKQEFSRLAHDHLGWVGGDENWKLHWLGCFGEEYPYSPRVLTTSRPFLATVDHSDSDSLAHGIAGIALTPDSTSDAADELDLVVLNPATYEAAFGKLFGTDVSKLPIWQELCREVGIFPVPPSIKKCKKALNGVLVNIYDLVQHRANPDPNKGPVRTFSSFKAFRKYTLAGKVFPKSRAKKDGFIRVLLCQLHPRCTI